MRKMEMTRDEHTTELAAKNAGGRVGREQGRWRSPAAQEAEERLGRWGEGGGSAGIACHHQWSGTHMDVWGCAGVCSDAWAGTRMSNLPHITCGSEATPNRRLLSTLARLRLNNLSPAHGRGW